MDFAKPFAEGLQGASLVIQQTSFDHSQSQDHLPFLSHLREQKN